MTFRAVGAMIILLAGSARGEPQPVKTPEAIRHAVWVQPLPSVASGLFGYHVSLGAHVSTDLLGPLVFELSGSLSAPLYADMWQLAASFGRMWVLALEQPGSPLTGFFVQPKFQVEVSQISERVCIGPCDRDRFIIRPLAPGASFGPGIDLGVQWQIAHFFIGLAVGVGLMYSINAPPPGGLVGLELAKYGGSNSSGWGVSINVNLVRIGVAF